VGGGWGGGRQLVVVVVDIFILLKNIIQKLFRKVGGGIGLVIWDNFIIKG
jgi:hypothetical protein